MQGIVATLCQCAIDGNQVLHAADLARQQNLPFRHAQFCCAVGRADGRSNQRLVHDLLGAPGRAACVIGIHQVGQQILVEAAPIDANAHRFVPTQGGLNHLGKLLVFLVAFAHVAGIDAVFGQSLGAIGKFRQQPVAVVMKVANQRHGNAHAVKLLTDVGHGLCRFRRIDGDAYQLGARQRQFLDLNGRANGICHVGIGHGLHTHRAAATDSDAVRAMPNQGLQSGMLARNGNGDGRCGFGLHAPRLSIHQGLSSKRAVPRAATLAKSKVCPRSITCTFSALPMITRTGYSAMASDC